MRRDILNFPKVETLQRLVINLEDITLAADLTTDQVSAVFESSLASKRLKKLSVGSSRLSQVDDTTLARAVSKFTGLEVAETELSNQQLTEIFRSVERSENIKELNISSNNLAGKVCSAYCKL